jgi:DNA-cytosine methyltransferase
MSCGQMALQKSNIEVNNYFSCEIDKYAIQVTRSNYPNTKQLGDVRFVTGQQFDDIGGINLLIGGSPCQGFSFAGKQLNFDDPRSALFFEYVRVLNELRVKNPDIKFLLENVKMKNEYQNVISKYLGVEPIEINSALVSAQNRKRLYWTNIEGIEQPDDKKILLKDIIEGECVFVDREKSNAIIASIGRTTPREYFYKRQGQMVFVDREKSYCIDANYYKGSNWQQYTTKARRQLVIEFINNDYLVRKLTPIECERLQTVPDNYTSCVSNSQRYKMLGNGWTVDVIAHILKSMPCKSK